MDFQGQEEAQRPPRRRQLFVCASGHSFWIFPDLNECQLLGRKTLRGNPERVFRSTGNTTVFSAGYGSVSGRVHEDARGPWNMASANC